jgi:hypothetical protein
MQKAFNRLFLIYSAFFFSSFVYLIVGFALSRSQFKPVFPASNLQQILFWIFVVFAISDVAIALKIKGRVFREDSSPAQEGEALQRRIVSRSLVVYALAEVPSILGLICFMFSANFTYFLILWLISLITFLMIRPSQESFDQIDRNLPS